MNAADGNGIIIGREEGEYLTLPGREHVAVYAKTGTGKTSGVVVPNCLHHRGSLIVLDVKGEIYQYTAGYRAEVLEQEVYAFDPAARDGRSHRWNPLQIVDRNAVDRFLQVEKVAFLLFPDATGGMNSSADAFWTPKARAAFRAVTLLIAETPEMPLTMDVALQLFTRGDCAEALVTMIEARRASGRPNYSRSVVHGVSDYLRGSPEQVDGIRAMTSARLAPWFNPRVVAATDASDFDLRDIRRKPMSIYVRVQPGNIDQMQAILALLFAAMMNLNSDVTPEQDPSIRYPVLVVLDEFARLGKMASLASAAQYARGYGLRFIYVTQNIVQLKALYGDHGAMDILDNVGAEIVFGTNDHLLTKELSERLGDDTINVITQNRPRFMPWMKFDKQSEAAHPHRRPLMLPQELARLDPSRQIILRAGMMPVNCEQARWYDDPTFTSRIHPPPVIPRLKVTVDLDDGLTKLGQPHTEEAPKEAAPA